MTSYNPKLEIFFNDINQLNIKNYQQYSHINKGRNIASGGVLILIRKDIPQHQINIDIEFGAIAVKAINICTIYLPAHDPLAQSAEAVEYTNCTSAEG